MEEPIFLCVCTVGYCDLRQLSMNNIQALLLKIVALYFDHLFLLDPEKAAARSDKRRRYLGTVQAISTVDDRLTG
jgi:hypothetical protein